MSFLENIKYVFFDAKGEFKDYLNTVDDPFFRNTYSKQFIWQDFKLSWESNRSGSFPVEIILRFHYRSELNHILLCSKLDKNIPGIEFYIGDGLSG